MLAHKLVPCCQVVVVLLFYALLRDKFLYVATPKEKAPINKIFPVEYAFS